MVLKGVGPDVVKAVHVIDIALEACSSYQNERPATLPPVEVHTVADMQECLLLSQGQLARRGCDFITPSGDTNEGCIILPPDDKGRRMRLRTKFNSHNLLVIDEPLRIAGTAGAHSLSGLSDTPVYHVNKAAYMLTKRKPLPALELANSYVITDVKPKPTTVRVAPVPAPQSARQLRSAAVRPSGQPNRSAGVEKSSAKSVKSINVRSVKVSEPKKAPTMTAPQVAPPVMSQIRAPVEEAPVTGPAQLVELPLSSCVARQQLGELPMRFGRPGDGAAAAIEAGNIRLTALLDA
jgi:hypothetical protein